MNVGQWLRVLDTVGGLAQMSGRLRRPSGEEPQASAMGAGPLGQLEARLAGVVVAALKEAFDRDRARMDLERSQVEAERQRAEAALVAELQRQAAERTLTQLRLIAVVAAAVWMLSAALGVRLPNMRESWPLLLMGSGWAAAIGALGCALGAWQQAANPAIALPHGSGTMDPGPPAPRTPAVTAAAHEPAHRAARAALALLLSSLALTGAALLAAL